MDKPLKRKNLPFKFLNGCAGCLVFHYVEISYFLVKVQSMPLLANPKNHKFLPYDFRNLHSHGDSLEVEFLVPSLPSSSIPEQVEDRLQGGQAGACAGTGQ